jgi:hypothetical protein
MVQKVGFITCILKQYFFKQKSVLHDACHMLAVSDILKELITLILKGTKVLQEPFKIKATRFFETSGNAFSPDLVSYYNNGFPNHIAVTNPKLA